MNARVANLISEMVPVKGAGMLTGTAFTDAQLAPRATHFFISAEAATALTFDGGDPDGEGAVVHTLAQGSNLTLRRSALLAMKAGAAVSISQWELG